MVSHVLNPVKKNPIGHLIRSDTQNHESDF
jgi:hypothetical protein